MKIRYFIPVLTGLLMVACNKHKEARNDKHSGGNGPAVPLIRDGAGPKVPGPGVSGPYAPGPSGGAPSGGASTLPAPDTTANPNPQTPAQPGQPQQPKAPGESAPPPPSTPQK